MVTPTEPDKKLADKLEDLAGSQAKLGRKWLRSATRTSRRVNRQLKKGQKRLEETLAANPLATPLAAGAAPETAAQAAAQQQGQIGMDWLNFAKDQFAVSQDRQAELDAISRDFAEMQKNISTADRARYENVFRPLEDQFVEEAKTWDSEARQADRAAKAAAGVETEAAAQRAASERALRARGVNPASGAYAGIDRAVGLGTALAKTDAMNTARDQLRKEAEAKRVAAINLGQPLQQTSQQAGNLAVGTVGNANQAWMQTPGIAGAGFTGALAGKGAEVEGLTAADRLALDRSRIAQGTAIDVNNSRNAAILNAAQLKNPGFAGAQTGLGQAATTTGNLYGLQTDLYRSQLEAAAAEQAGIGEALGTVVGAAAPFVLSDEKKKQDRAPVEEGKALAAVEKMPVDSWRYAPGLDGGRRHVGPMAQDMKKHAGVGDGETIPTVDAIGITLKAVKDLSKKVDRLAVGLGKRAPQPMKKAA